MNLHFSLCEIFLVLVWMSKIQNFSIPPRAAEKAFTFSPNVLFLEEMLPEKLKLEKIPNENTFVFATQNSIQFLSGENFRENSSLKPNLSNISFSFHNEESLVSVIGCNSSSRWTFVNVYDWRNRSFLYQEFEIEGIFTDIIRIPGTRLAIIYEESHVKLISLSSKRIWTIEHFEAGIKKCLLAPSKDELLCQYKKYIKKCRLAQEERCVKMSFEGEIKEMLIAEHDPEISVYLTGNKLKRLNPSTLEEQVTEAKIAEFLKSNSEYGVLHEGLNAILLRTRFSLRFLARDGLKLSNPVYFLGIHSVHVSDKNTSESEISNTYVSVKISEREVVMLKYGGIFNESSGIALRKDYKFKFFNNTAMIMARSPKNENILSLFDLEKERTITEFDFNSTIYAFDFERDNIYFTSEQGLFKFNFASQTLALNMPFSALTISSFRLFSFTSSSGIQVWLLFNNSKLIIFHASCGKKKEEDLTFLGLLNKPSISIYFVESNSHVFLLLNYDGFVTIIRTGEDCKFDSLTKYIDDFKTGFVASTKRNKIAAGQNNHFWDFTVFELDNITNTTLSLPFSMVGNFILLIDGLLIDFGHNLFINLTDSSNFSCGNGYLQADTSCLKACDNKNNFFLNLTSLSCEKNCSHAPSPSFQIDACSSQCPDNRLHCEMESSCDFSSPGTKIIGNNCTTCEILFPQQNCEDCTSNVCFFPHIQPGENDYKIIFGVAVGFFCFLLLVLILIALYKIKKIKHQKLVLDERLLVSRPAPSNGTNTENDNLLKNKYDQVDQPKSNDEENPDDKNMFSGSKKQDQENKECEEKKELSRESSNSGEPFRVIRQGDEKKDEQNEPLHEKQNNRDSDEKINQTENRGLQKTSESGHRMLLERGSRSLNSHEGSKANSSENGFSQKTPISNNDTEERKEEADDSNSFQYQENFCENNNFNVPYFQPNESSKSQPKEQEFNSNKLNSEETDGVLYREFLNSHRNLINYDKNELANAIKTGEDTVSSATEAREGGYGRVFKIKYRNNVLAAKKILMKTVGSFRKVLEELEFLAKGQSSFVVNFKYVFPMELEASSDIYLIMDWIELTLDSVIRDKKLTLNFSDKLKIFQELASGVKHLQIREGKFIVHGDIKPKNILVLTGGGEDLQFKRVVFADFGSALELENAKGDAKKLFYSSKARTKIYASPEKLTESSVGCTSDIFSLGLVILELFFGNLDKKDLKSLKKEPAYLESLEKKFPMKSREAGILAILKEMLKTSWKERSNIDYVLEKIKEIKQN